MYAASQAFLAAVRHSHTKIHRLDVIGADQDRFSLNIEKGSEFGWSLDATVRTNARIACVDPSGELIPSDAENLLSPFTAKLALQRGIRFSDGSEELVPLGRVRVVDTNVSVRDGLTVIDLECLDQSTRAQEPTTRPVAIESGTPVHQAIPQLLVERVPTLTFRMTETPFTCPSLLIGAGEDAWAEAVKLARTAGCDLFIDRDLDEDVVTMSPRVLEAHGSAVVWHFEEGVNADFWDPERSLTSDNVPNVVIVEATHSSVASGSVEGEAWDNDPASPTYRYGAYDEKVFRHPEPRVATREHATSMARAILSRKLGAADEVTLSAVPNPALALGDTVAATCSRTGLDGRPMLVTDIDPMPLDAEGEMAVTLRRSIVTDADTPLETT